MWETIAKGVPTVCRLLRFFTRKQPKSPPQLWALIVEDNKLDAELLELVLRRVGFQTQTVSTGEAAQGVLRRDTYDLVLVDLQLSGGMPGAALLRVLSEDAPYTRVVVVTGCAADLPPSEPVIVIVKPVTAESLRKVKKLLK